MKINVVKTKFMKINNSEKMISRQVKGNPDTYLWYVLIDYWKYEEEAKEEYKSRYKEEIGEVLCLEPRGVRGVRPPAEMLNLSILY